jgi:quercetin dioxygenase-like cupin family protein
VKVLSGFPSARPERYASAVLHDEANVRIVGFVLGAGQEVGVHESPSSVVVQVVRGGGRFTGAGTDAQLEAGQVAVFEPGEPHGMEAGPDGLDFVAVIAPGPSATLHGLGAAAQSSRPAAGPGPASTP